MRTTQYRFNRALLLAAISFCFLLGAITTMLLNPQQAISQASETVTVTLVPQATIGVTHVENIPAQNQAQLVLLESVAHYRTHLQQGIAALGTHQYATALEGVAAFNDPTSAASLFSNWRVTSGVETDISYMDAYVSAVAQFTADTEPTDALVACREALAQSQVDLSAWVGIAVSWQIKGATNEQLDLAEKQVLADLDVASQAITQVK